MCAFVYVCVCVCACVRVCSSVYTYMHASVHACVYVCGFVNNMNTTPSIMHKAGQHKIIYIHVVISLFEIIKK